MNHFQRTVLVLAIALTGLQLSASARVEARRNRWTKQAPIPTWFSLQGIAPISTTECWIASAPLLDDVGELAHTTDAGRTWNVVSVDRQVNAVAFIDSLHGWAAGNAFFHTTDGGQNWIKDNNFSTVYDLFFFDTLHGWASGNGAVNYYTVDGGLHWTGVSAPGDSTIGSIFFTDLLNGIAGEENLDFEDALFLDAQRGWVGGNTGIWQRR